MNGGGPLARLRHHVTGAIERGEAQAIAGIPALEPHCGSWVVICRETGRAVLETYSAAVAGKVNQSAYEVRTAAQWLASLSRKGGEAHP